MKYTNEQYMSDALKTEARDFSPVAERLQDVETIRLLHAGIGLTTEVGEVLDALKKHVFYGKPLDRVNLKEEMGDLMWYMAVMANTLGISFEDAMRVNSEKLKARYGDKFSETAALVRNLDKERKILEG